MIARWEKNAICLSLYRIELMNEGLSGIGWVAIITTDFNHLIRPQRYQSCPIARHPNDAHEPAPSMGAAWGVFEGDGAM